MKIKFLQDVAVEAQGEIVERYSVGEVVEMSNASGWRWLRRQVAVPCDVEEAVVAPAVEPEPVAEPVEVTEEEVAGTDDAAADTEAASTTPPPAPKKKRTRKSSKSRTLLGG